MKKLILNFAILFCIGMVANAQSVGINQDGDDPHESAGLDVDFDNKGVLMPRLTTAERDAISNPATSLMIYNTDTQCYESFNGNVWRQFGCIGEETIVHEGFEYETVLNPTTGKAWLDRNLGALQVAISSTDADSYGDLYQWGRGMDGHQLRTSGTTGTLSGSDTPGHDNFITNGSSSPYDWRSPQNDNLWQGVSGINNPCPEDYRLPTETELDAERLSWTSNNSAGAFASPLKLPMAGYRDNNTSSLDLVGSDGDYWSSTVNGTNAMSMFLHSSNANTDFNLRTFGFSVRCIKD